MSSERRKPYRSTRLSQVAAIWDERQIFHAPNPGEKNFDAPSRNSTCSICFVSERAVCTSDIRKLYGYRHHRALQTDARVQFLHPMGWDAFGLPAEQYAIKSGQHPAVTTENVTKFKSQLKRIGFSMIGR